MKWQKDWLYERLLAKESEMLSKVQCVTGESTTKAVIHDILEQMNGEEVMYRPFWDIEEKHARNTWDEEDHPDTKRPAFSSPTKILKRDKLYDILPANTRKNTKNVLNQKRSGIHCEILWILVN